MCCAAGPFSETLPTRTALARAFCHPYANMLDEHTELNENMDNKPARIVLRPNDTLCVGNKWQAHERISNCFGNYGKFMQTIHNRRATTCVCNVSISIRLVLLRRLAASTHYRQSKFIRRSTDNFAGITSRRISQKLHSPFSHVALTFNTHRRLRCIDSFEIACLRAIIALSFSILCAYAQRAG